MLRNILAWIFAFALVVPFLADWLHLFQTRGKHYFVVLLDVIIDAILLFGFIYLMSTPWA